MACASAFPPTPSRWPICQISWQDKASRGFQIAWCARNTLHEFSRAYQIVCFQNVHYRRLVLTNVCPITPGSRKWEERHRSVRRLLCGDHRQRRLGKWRGGPLCFLGGERQGAFLSTVLSLSSRLMTNACCLLSRACFLSPEELEISLAA
jgi:hypothetical protein